MFRALLLSFAVLSCALSGGASPRIYSFAPMMGAPGTQVTILGDQLRGVTQVLFGNARGNILQGADSFLTVVVPLDATSGAIYVYDQSGQFDYTFTAFQVAPRVSVFTPNHGVFGEEVVLDGFNFSNINNPEIPTHCYFSDVEAPLYVASDTQLRATVPIGAMTGPIKITTLAGSYTTPSIFYLPPIITSFEPERAHVGEILTFKGFNFTGARLAQVGGANATILNAQLTQMMVVIPVGALDGNLYVETPGGAFFSDPSKPFLLLPKIDSFAPPGGPPSTEVKILGTGLTKASQVYVGDTATPVTQSSALSASFVVPNGALTGPLTIVTPNGTNQSLALFYLAPTVESFTPVRGQTGTVVTVTGLNLVGTTKVEFGGISAPEFSVINTTRLSARVPVGAQSGVIRVTNPGGVASSSLSFEVVGDEPTITSFTPTFGGPGALITLNGFNFSDATNVTFGGVSSPPTVQGDTRIVVAVPTGASSGKIRVFSPRGIGESTGEFTVGDSADLKLTLTASPNPPVVGARLIYTIDVRNNGPLDATSVILTFAIPKEADYVSATSSRGTWEKLGSGVINTVGRLDSGATATLLVMVKPKAEGTITAAAQVTSDTPDSNAPNNSAKLILSAVPVSLTIDALANGFVRIVWPDAATNYVLEATAALQSPVWSDVTNTVFHIEDEFRVAVPFVPDANRFFRLRQLPP